MYKRKKEDEKQRSVQEFLNVEDIADKLIYSADGYLFGFLQVKASGTSMLDEDEKLRNAEALAVSLATTGEHPMQIIAIPRTLNIVGMIETLSGWQKQTDSDAKLRLIDGEIHTLQQMAQEGAKEPMIVLKCWEKAARGADKEINKRLDLLEQRLTENGVSARRMEDPEIVYLCKLFGDLAEYHDAQEGEYEDVPTLQGKKRLFTKRKAAAELSDEDVLRSLIAPIGGISFDVSRVYIGAVIGRVYAAMRYPAELDYNWAVELVNSTDCVTSILYLPGNAAIMGNALSKSVTQSAVEAATQRDVRMRKRFERQAQDADKLLETIDFDNAAVGHVCIFSMPFTSDEREFEDVCRSVSNRYAKRHIKLRPLGNLQQEAFQCLTPYHVPSFQVVEMAQQIMPLLTLMGGTPMTVSSLRDDKGIFWAKTNDGGVVSINMTLRGGDRTNGNLIAAGKSGLGKSTALKHIMQNLYLSNFKVLIIDVEREYKQLCKGLNGTWLDMGGGVARVNPLQVRPVPRDTEDEEDKLYQSEENDLALHINTLDIFFSLAIPAMTEMHKNLLKRELIALYRSVGIDWDTDIFKLSNEDFPIIADLHRQIAAHKGEAMYEELALFLEDMAIGATSFLWNGHTNVDLNSDFVVLDTNRIATMPDHIKRAQYFNILSLCWEKGTEHRHEPVLVLCDEAHVVLDPVMPQTAMYLRNMGKRCRKYEMYLFTVFQAFGDMLFPEIQLYGQAILDNANFKLAFGCDGKNLADTAEILQLTQQEKKRMSHQVRGQALLVVGSQRLPVTFEIPQYKMQLMGEGGGS